MEKKNIYFIHYCNSCWMSFRAGWSVKKLLLLLWLLLHVVSIKCQLQQIKMKQKTTNRPLYFVRSFVLFFFFLIQHSEAYNLDEYEIIFLLFSFRFFIILKTNTISNTRSHGIQFNSFPHLVTHQR